MNSFWDTAEDQLIGSPCTNSKEEVAEACRKFVKSSNAADIIFKFSNINYSSKKHSLLRKTPNLWIKLCHSIPSNYEINNALSKTVKNLIIF